MKPGYEKIHVISCQKILAQHQQTYKIVTQKTLLEENPSASTSMKTVFSPGDACNVYITGS